MWRAAARHLSKQRFDFGARSRFQQPLLAVPQIFKFQESSSFGAVVQGVDRHYESDLVSPGGASILFQLHTPLEEVLDAALLALVQLPWLPQSAQLGHSRFKSRYDDRGLKSLECSHAFASSVEYADYGDGESQLYEEGAESVVANFETKSKEENSEQKKAKMKSSELYKRQMKMETEAWTLAEAQYRELITEMCRKNLAPNLPVVQLLLVGWYEPLRDAIAEEQKAFAEGEFRGDRASYGPFLCQLPASQLAVITMHCLIEMLMSNKEMGCVKVAQAALHVGEAVEQEVLINRLVMSKKKKIKSMEGKSSTNCADNTKTNPDTEKLEVMPEDILDEVRNRANKLLKQRKLRLVKNILRKASGKEPWGPPVYAKVGSRLLELFLETAMVRTPPVHNADDIPQVQPAFKYTTKHFLTRSSSRHKAGVIGCSPLVLKEIDKSVRYMTMPYMPMVVKPKRWTGFYDGGHLVLKSSIMRTRGSTEQRDTIFRTPRESMSKVFKALDALGETSWRLNKPVLDILEKIWSEGGGLANLVEADDVILLEKPDTDSADELKTWRRETGIAKRTNCERHSLRCDVEIKLSVAQKLRNEEAFYFPHNLDFRGRAYPMHSNLNHLGSDMCRGILEFAEGKPLGRTGLRWLKIHLANLYGGSVSKLSFDARVAHIDSHMHQVFDSAERPLEGKRWWLEAEDPFQFLATCMDVRNAITSESPETYRSYLPVHQDGSCNGLQHYAALGRDRIGAESVNLIAGGKPADVYSDIADRVRKIIEKEALKNPEANKNAALAKILLEQIDRKLVKQTVMTSVYGVTFVGARAQVMNRLKERGTINDSDLYQASCYAAKIILNALGESFKEARRMMTWLSECAQIIAQGGNTVKWTTPLGLQVVQPYRKPGRQLVKTSLQDIHIRVLDTERPVLRSRQKSAFPPNFVHALDSTHMMMTALACKRAGIFFAGVHDSYWTHAGDVDILNKFTRKKFVELYSQPILENLLQDFQEQHPDLTFPEVPPRGVLDLKEVLKAPYFFN